MCVQVLDQNVKATYFSEELFATDDTLMVDLIKKCLADEVSYKNTLSGILYPVSFKY